MKRFFNWLRALGNLFMTRVEDPTMMIDQSLIDAKAQLNKNREAAVQALAQKNRLEQLLHESQLKEANFLAQAKKALQMGNEEIAKSAALQLQQQKANTTQLQDSFDHAVETCDQVKLAINKHEQKVRGMMAEAATLKARAKSAEVQNNIEKAMSAIEFDLNDSAYNNAKDKIFNSEALAKARQEMRKDSFTAKMDSLEDASQNQAADDALSSLREQLGLTTNSTATTTVQPGNVDQELQKLINPV